MVMHTGPVAPILNDPTLNQTIQADSQDTFAWATVVTPDPLSIVFDGQTAPVPGVPASCVPMPALLPDARVWVQRHSPDGGHSAARRNIVIGLAGGGNPWVGITMESGFADDPDHHMQVKLDGSGLVDIQGRMTGNGFTSSQTGRVKFAQLPDGYWPVADAYWIGFQTSFPSSPYGGWVAAGDGGLYLWVDGSNTHWPPAAPFCIIVQPWEPVPAQPY